ncbi:hypothetical protein [Candidatus Methanoperedens nitratireducens]|uniref:Uncharacterized protein n=1 Tax=Candidatus Methanoperedens nitratireducens TaxID=1392998 RepID=A0A284VRE2_9EURY|nr:hypothetical protein [Candidatus Methanoperedens nitroreducens]SNQ61832.1 hypothetical protein MNV_50091 [Candidatus Methanoperedens nitroreducens]
MNRRGTFIIVGIMILAISGCLQSTKENVSVTPTPGVTPVPTTVIPATSAATEIPTPQIPTPQITPVPTIKNLSPGTLYVIARMLTPSYWGNNNYELRAFKVEIYNQGTAPLNIKAQVNNDGQTLEERSFSLKGGGNSYQFINDRNHFINSTNVTLRLIVNGYQPVNYSFESVSSLG